MADVAESPAMDPHERAFRELLARWVRRRWERERRDRCIVAELKSFRGRRDFQHGQKEWLTAWRAIEQRTHGAVRAFTWTPMDWDEIERELREGTR